MIAAIIIGTWTLPGYLIAPALLAVALFLYAVDPPLMAWIQRRRCAATNAVAKVVKPLGDGRYTIPPLILVFFAGWLLHLPWLQRAGLLAVISFFVTGFFIQSLQALGRRHRPDTLTSARHWEGPHLRNEHRSFPSGHASVSTSIFVVIALLAPGMLPGAAGLVLAIVAYALAALVGLSRLNDHAHWPSDVFVGASIGTAVAWATVAYSLQHFPL